MPGRTGCGWGRNCDQLFSKIFNQFSLYGILDPKGTLETIYFVQSFYFGDEKFKSQTDKSHLKHTKLKVAKQNQ